MAQPQSLLHHLLYEPPEFPALHPQLVVVNEAICSALWRCGGLAQQQLTVDTSLALRP